MYDLFKSSNTAGLSPQQARRARLLFRLNWIAFVTTVGYIPFYFVVENLYFISFEVFASSVVGLNFYFLQKKRLDVAAFILPSILILSIEYASVVTPKVGTELLLIPISIVLLPVFRKVIHAVIMFTAIITSYISIELIKKDLVGIVQYSDFMNHAVYFTNIGVIFIVSFLIVYYFHKSNLHFQNKLEEQNQIISDHMNELEEKSKLILKEQKKNHALELKQKQNNLQTHQLNSALKINLLQDIINEIDVLQANTENLEDSINSFARNLQHKLKSAEKLNLLQSDLDSVNAEFYDKLEDKFPSLSKTEREICAFIKLKLSNHDIAMLRNTTSNAINVVRYRIKKKMGLEKSGDLDKIILKL